MYLIFFFTILFIIYVYFIIINCKIFYKSEIKNIYEDKLKLNELFIIGTHDSLSYTINNYLSYFAKTNFLNLSLQLKYNVRFFDIRFKIIKNKLIGYHSFINLNISHKTVFDTFINFLKLNNNQYIIIILRNEEFKDHEKIIIFLQNNYIKPNKLESYFMYNNSNWTLNPSVESLKGKIFILNVDNNNNIMPWADDRNFSIGNLYIYDKYSSTIHEKCNDYKNMINKISNQNNNKINIFFTSMAFNNIYNIKYNAKQISKCIKKNSINKNYILVTDYNNYYI